MGIGISEILLVLFIALIVVGPRRLPDLAFRMGQMVRKLKQSTTEITRSITAEVEDETKEIRSYKDGIKREIDSITGETTADLSDDK